MILYGTVIMETVETVRLSKREENRLERRKAIIAVAGQSFLERGYAGTTMSGVSAAIGGSKGTLWSYFASKEELFSAFIGESVSEFQALLTQVLDQSASLDTTLETLCCEVLIKLTAPDALALYRLVAGESGRSPEIGRIFYEHGPQVLDALLSRFLTDQIAKGQLCEGDGAAMAETLISMCLGRYHTRVLLGVQSADRAIAQNEARRICADFFALYAPRGTPPATG